MLHSTSRLSIVRLLALSSSVSLSLSLPLSLFAFLNPLRAVLYSMFVSYWSVDRHSTFSFSPKIAWAACFASSTHPFDLCHSVKISSFSYRGPQYTVFWRSVAKFTLSKTQSESVFHWIEWFTHGVVWTSYKTEPHRLHCEWPPDKCGSWRHAKSERCMCPMSPNLRYVVFGYCVIAFAYKTHSMCISITSRYLPWFYHFLRPAHSHTSTFTDCWVCQKLS